MSNSNKSTHKLVVIMFTDIVGYSKLVQINEDTALELLVEIFKRPGYLHWRDLEFYPFFYSLKKDEKFREFIKQQKNITKK